MVDLSETPAVPPEDFGGDDRVGLFAAGGTLVALGWGLGVVVNVLIHWTSPAGGTVVGPVVVHHALGAFAWATLLIGVFTGALGAAMAVVGRSSPKGRLVLPGGVY